ncbi:MAG: diacylglycerol/polyprenol kinase family protein, partial [Opitutaceae bacterium]
MNPVYGIALVVALLGALMLSVRALQQRSAIDAELARKLVHMGMGSVCLAFPWIFADAPAVWVLAGIAVTSLAAVRLAPVLRVRFGGVLGGVKRVSLGEIYFPCAVALVFTLAGGDRAAFCAPVAILTFADAAGALVGHRWGRLRYQAVESTKSFEGSTAVFAVTWICAAVVLAGLGGVTAERALLVGMVMALFAALVEAVSWRGLDNLLVPLVAFAQMKIYPELTAAQLLARGVVMVLLVLFMLNWRRHLLDSSARLGAGLAIYFFWSVGDWRWLVAPAVLLVSYTRLMPTIPGGPPRHNFTAVLCIASAGVIWAVANARLPAEHWLWLYTLGFATQQAIVAAVRFSQGRPHWHPWRWWLVAAAQGTGLHAIAFLAVNGTEWWSRPGFVVSLAAPGLALAAFMGWDQRLQAPEDDNARWWRQGVIAGLAPTIG